MTLNKNYHQEYKSPDLQTLNQQLEIEEDLLFLITVDILIIYLETLRNNKWKTHIIMKIKQLFINQWNQNQEVN